MIAASGIQVQGSKTTAGLPPSAVLWDGGCRVGAVKVGYGEETVVDAAMAVGVASVDP
jgi:hypothetical protein